VSVLEPGVAPAGVRRVEGETGIRASRLSWVEAGPFELAPGDRVAVRENGDEWLAEVVVPPAHLVEWDTLGDLPVIARRVPASEWPSGPIRDGRRLLESLALPPELLTRRQPGSAPGLLASGSGPSEPTQHQRSDQQQGGDHREPD
jgi:hypothetical protein